MIARFRPLNNERVRRWRENPMPYYKGTLKVVITVQARNAQKTKDKLTDKFEAMQRDIRCEDFEVKRISKKDYEASL